METNNTVTPNIENIESAELQEMRQQMAELKSQLDEQLQINEQSLRKNIMKKTNSINSFGTWSLMGGLLVAILFPFVFHRIYDFSIACCLATSILCIVDACHDYYSAHRISKSKISSGNVKENIETLISMKKNNKTAFVVGLFCIVPLFFWWGYEIMNTPYFDEMGINIEIAKYSLIGSVLVGSVIGGIFAVKLYKKQQKNISEMIDMISETK